MTASWKPNVLYFPYLLKRHISFSENVFDVWKIENMSCISYTKIKLRTLGTSMIRSRLWFPIWIRYLYRNSIWRKNYWWFQVILPLYCLILNIRYFSICTFSSRFYKVVGESSTKNENRGFLALEFSRRISRLTLLYHRILGKNIHRQHVSIFCKWILAILRKYSNEAWKSRITRISGDIITCLQFKDKLHNSAICFIVESIRKALKSKRHLKILIFRPPQL